VGTSDCSQEGIFAGAPREPRWPAPVKYAAKLPADRLIVVIFQDSGSRYLSKFYDNQMDARKRCPGLPNMVTVTLGDLFAWQNQIKPSLQACLGEGPMRKVMTKNCRRWLQLSQMPVVLGNDGL